MRKIVSSCDVCDFTKELPIDSMESTGVETFNLMLGSQSAFDNGYRVKDLCEECRDKLRGEIEEFVSKSKYFVEIPEKL